MSFGADCLINKLNTNITGLGATNQTSLDFAQLGGALNSLENSFCSVATITDLPAACDNEGRFIYVTGCRSFRYSDGYEWLMNACSVCNATTGLFTWGPFLGLGDGTTVDRCSPGTVAGGGINWCRVSSTGSSTAAIKCDGTLWTWGSNFRGILGDGTSEAINRSSPGTVAGGGTNWCQVSSYCNHMLAIKTDGTLWTWGYNAQGRLGNGTTVSRCSPGTVAGGGTNWCQVSTGGFHSIAIKTDGTIWTWGNSSQGELGNGTTVNRCSPGTIWGNDTTWCQVSGGYHTAAIKCDGTLWTWGFNTQGGLGDGTTVNRCSPGTIAGGGTNWCQICTANKNSSAVKCDATLWTWGYNGQGRLGDGTITNRCSPGTVAGGGTNWCQVSMKFRTTSAIKTDGTLWTWGYNGGGVLGDGTTVSRCSPGTVAGGGTNWCRVVSYGKALKSRGF